MLKTAKAYLAAGLCVLPAHATEKRPAVSSWREYQKRLPNGEMDSWDWPRLCIICGAISGNLEVIDFDAGGEAMVPWSRLLDSELFDKLVVEMTPSGGYHVIYRCEEPVAGNQKLASRGGEVLIETRGEGGLILAAPSQGYELIDGVFERLPVLTKDERGQLLSAARSLNEDVEPPRRPQASRDWEGEDRPGDRYNAKGDILGLLTGAGWDVIKHQDGQQFLRRPGKTGRAWSGTLKDGIFYCFSMSASPFDAGRSYDAFGVFATLKHGGDFGAAAEALIDRIEPIDPRVDISALLAEKRPSEPKPEFPRECLRELPAVLRAAFDFAMATAIKPQPELTMAALVSMFGACLGRRVMDDYGTRSNIMYLALAPSGSGKEHPRQIVKQILRECDVWSINGPERIGSHAGVVSALVGHPVRLFQIDEIGRLLATMSHADKSPHLYNIATVLMQLYSSAGTTWTGDAYADSSKVKEINQPCLCLFGTSVPDTFYKSIQAENLIDGLLGRMLIVESDYGPRQKPAMMPVPDLARNAIEAWQAMQAGNLGDQNPKPLLIEKTPDAEHRHEWYCQTVHERHEGEGEVARAIWSRAPEKAAKLALIHACCKGPNPTIDLDSIEWGRKLVNYSNRLVIWSAGQQVAENKFEVDLLYAWRKLKDGMTRRELSRKCRRFDGRALKVALHKLEEMGAIAIEEKPNKRGSPTPIIRVVGHISEL